MPSIKDVRARLAVREAVVEASELLTLVEHRAHRLVALEVAKVLLAQPRLRRNLDCLPIEGSEDRKQSLPCTQVRRHEEAHRLIANELPNLQPSNRALSESVLRQRDLRVWGGAVGAPVYVALRLAVAHQDDAIRPLLKFLEHPQIGQGRIELLKIEAVEEPHAWRWYP